MEDKKLKNPIPSWMRPYVLIPWKILDAKNLTKYEKMVLISIMRHLNMDDEIAFPAMRTIAQEWSTSKSSVCKAILSLEKKGVLGVGRPNRRGIEKHNNVYSIDTTKLLGYIG